jgi:phage-related protein
MRKAEGQSRASETKQPGPPSVRPITWIASSKDDLSVLPREVKASFGLRLYELQQGKTPLDMKPLPQFGTGVYECGRALTGTPIGSCMW